MDFDWMKIVSTAGDLYKTVSTTQAQTSAASAATTAATANLQAQQLAQQNLQNQLLLAAKQSQTTAANPNKTMVWVAVGVGAVLLITVFIVVLAKRR
jgi:hypothetical protein